MDYIDHLLKVAPMNRICELAVRSQQYNINRDAFSTLFNIVLFGTDEHAEKVFEMTFKIQEDKLKNIGIKNLKG